MIHERDGSDALGIAEKQWQQLDQPYELELPNPKNFSNIVYAGMGGSALAAEYVKVWPACKVPFEIIRNYELPHYVDEATLTIIASYSGNTEEALSALSDAETMGSTIVIIAGGGKLAEEANIKGYPLLILPKAAQPRYAVLYNFDALVTILETLGLLDANNIRQEIAGARDFLKEAVVTWRADVPTAQNPAKKLALELMGSSPVIYGSPITFPVAYKWKISFNENAKNVAWCNQYSEFNHNEFLGWSSHPIDKPYKIVDLRSSFDNQQISKRFDLSAKMLSGKRPAPHTVNLEGDTLLKQLLWGTAFGDFVTLYVALLNGLNPTPVDLIEKFKVELSA